MALPLADFCRAVLWWCLERVEDREKFMYLLEQPVPTADSGRVSESQVQAELDDFANFMASF